MHLILEKQVAPRSWGKSTQRKSKVDLFLLLARGHHSVPPNNPAGRHNDCALTSVSVRKVTKKMLNVSAGRVQQRHYRKYPQNGDRTSDSSLCFSSVSCLWRWRPQNEVFISMAATDYSCPYHGEKFIMDTSVENFLISGFFYKDFLYSCLLLKDCIKMRLSRKPGFHQFSLLIL